MLMLFSLTINASSKSERPNEEVILAINASRLRYRAGSQVYLLARGVEQGFRAELSDGENYALVTSPKKDTVHVDNASFDRLPSEKQIDHVSDAKIMGHPDVKGYVLVYYTDGSSEFLSEQALYSDKTLRFSR